MRWLNWIALGYIAISTLYVLMRSGPLTALLVFVAWSIVYLIFYGLIRLLMVARPKPVEPEVIDEDDPIYNKLPNMERK